MTVQLSSLRITADMDVSGYTRAMANKVAADRAGAASSTAVADSIQRVDTAFSGSGGAVSRLARAHVDGAGSAQKLQQGITQLGRPIKMGQVSTKQATTIYQGMVMHRRGKRLGNEAGTEFGVFLGLCVPNCGFRCHYVPLSRMERLRPDPKKPIGPRPFGRRSVAQPG